MDGDYAKGRLNICFGHKGTLTKGEEKVNGIVNGNIPKRELFNWNVCIYTGGGFLWVGKMENGTLFVVMFLWYKAQWGDTEIREGRGGKGAYGVTIQDFSKEILFEYVRV